MLPTSRMPSTQLDQMSGRRDSFGNTQDFDRTDVLKAIHGLDDRLQSNDRTRRPRRCRLAQPLHVSDERTIFWLATVGSGEVPGIGKMDPKMKNVGGELYWRELVALADSQAAKDTRAMAIQALGLVREPSLREPIERWLGDPEPAIRACGHAAAGGLPRAGEQQTPGGAGRRCCA